MERVTKAFITLMTLLSSVGCDQITKNIVRKNLAYGELHSFMHDVLRLQYVENHGAFLGLGAGADEHTRFLVFTIVAGFALIGLIGYLFYSNKASRTETVAVSLIVGGGMANILDRVYNHGGVIDFMNIGIGPLRTGIFNVADIAITFGVLWLLVHQMKNSAAHSTN